MIQESKMYITGDRGGRIEAFQENKFLNELPTGSYLFITGDFSFVFSRKGESMWEKMKLDLIKRGNYITCIIDGNHENHYALETYPREKWRGGMVHVIRRDSSGNPKIVHLIRGEVYGINGKRIFVFGGAHSEDCQYRKAYRNWWPDRELPDREEMARGVRNLKKNNWQTDFVLTHTMPAGVFQPGFRHYGDQEETELREYLEKIRSTCSFQRWYSGHIHLDADIDDKHTSLLDDIRNMETNEIVGSMKLKEKK